MPCPPPGDFPNSGIEPRSPTLQVDSLPSEPSEKPKNTGMDSLSLLQGNFPTQESNWDLVHCRQILCQLSYLFQGRRTNAGEEIRKLTSIMLMWIFSFNPVRLFIPNYR